MKILFIRNTERISGSETYNINLFGELKKVPFLDIYFLTNLYPFANLVSKLGIKTQVIPWGAEGIGTKKQLFRTFFRLPYIIFKYISIIRLLEKSDHFDLICLQSMTEKVFLTPLLRMIRYHVIWTELGPIYATKMSRLVTFLYKVASFFAEKIITISNDTKHDLVHGGINDNKIVSLYIGIDTNKFKPLYKTRINRLRKKNNINTEYTVIGFLGTITDEKGIEDFIEISNLLYQRNRKVYFIVIGDGPLLSWSKISIEKLKLTQQYFFTGFLENVTDYLGLLDIMLLPTRHYEGLPLAILEAQAMGKIVIASSMGGNPEIIDDGKNGFLYKKLSTVKIANLIDNLSKNKSLKISIGINARANILKRFNSKFQAKKFIKLFQTYDHRN